MPERVGKPKLLSFDSSEHTHTHTHTHGACPSRELQTFLSSRFYLTVVEISDACRSSDMPYLIELLTSVDPKPCSPTAIDESPLHAACAADKAEVRLGAEQVPVGSWCMGAFG